MITPQDEVRKHFEYTPGAIMATVKGDGITVRPNLPVKVAVYLSHELTKWHKKRIAAAETRAKIEVLEKIDSIYPRDGKFDPENELRPIRNFIDQELAQLRGGKDAKQ